jgi:hypothetical protein
MPTKRTSEPKVDQAHLVTPLDQRRSHVLEPEGLDAEEWSQPEAFVRRRGTEEQYPHRVTPVSARKRDAS